MMLLREASADKSDTSPRCVKYSAETGAAYALPMEGSGRALCFGVRFFLCFRREGPYADGKLAH